MTSSSDDAHRITTLEQLRQVLPEPNPVSMSKVLDHLDDQGIAFLKDAPFLLLATATREGRIEVSPKGDEPGFVKVEDERSVLIPDRAGNNLAFGLTNIIENPRVGVIVMRPMTGETLRFSGMAEISADPTLLETLSARGKPALLAIRVRIEHAYFHCARSILRAGLWQPDTWLEARKISFGKILRKQLRGEPSLEAQIDQSVEKAYLSGL